MKPYHVTSLPLSLALREAGYPQGKSIFVYRKYKYQEKHVLELRESLKRLIVEDELDRPLASEILEEMPKHVKGHVLQICPGFKEGGWFAGYGDHMNLNGFLVEDGDTLCDALSKLWLHIHSQNII